MFNEQQNPEPPPPAANPKSFSALLLFQTLLLCIACAFLGLIWHNQQQESYGYVLLSPSDAELERDLNKLGAMGFEVVSARRATSGYGEKSEARYEMILKRRGPLPFATK